jgi:hypothetical protein
MDTHTTSEGVLAMGHLLLNSLAGHASRAFVAQKTARPDQVPFLVDNHHLAETETFHQQATGAQTKKIVSKMLTICSLSGPDEKWENLAYARRMVMDAYTGISIYVASIAAQGRTSGT